MLVTGEDQPTGQVPHPRIDEERSGGGACSRASVAAPAAASSRARLAGRGGGGACSRARVAVAGLLARLRQRRLRGHHVYDETKGVASYCMDKVRRPRREDKI